MAKPTHNELIEQVRNMNTVDAHWTGEEFRDGYTQGQNDMLDRIVELLESVNKADS